MADRSPRRGRRHEGCRVRADPVADQRLLDRMRQARDNGDTEGAHSDADQVLLAAVRRHAPPAFARKLIALYRDVDKWYA